MNNLIVRQGNVLIESSYKIASLGEGRLIRLLLAQIKPEDEELKAYRISVADFAMVFGLNSQNGRLFELIDKASEALVSRKISIREEGKKSFIHMNWLSSAKYVDGEGYVELRFDVNLKPFLLQLKGYFTQYGLDRMIHFKSVYSIRLFELLKIEEFKANHIGKFTRKFEYEELREKMGIEQDEYPFFKDFRVRIIETAKKELNTNSDIFISDVEYLKTMRKVSHIIFHCEKSKQTYLNLQDGSPSLKEVKEVQNAVPQEIQDLVGLGIAESTALKWRKKYGIDRIKRNTEYTIAKQKAGKVRDPAGYLSRAIADDSASGWAITEAKKKENAQKKQVEANQTTEATDQATQERLALRKRLLSEFEAMDESEKSRLIELVCDTGKMVKYDYEKHGTSGGMFTTNLIIQLKKERGID
jgi:plasmid replication initiation protein